MAQEIITRQRSTKYEAWMDEAIVQVAREGGHIAAMCVKIGIKSEDTFHRWKKDYPSFREAYDEARMVSKALHESHLLQGSLGQIHNFNGTSYALIMHNKFAEDYKSNINQTTEITVNQLTLTPEQLDSKIAQKLEKLKSLGIALTDES